MKAPCKDCQNRRVGCHSECEKYISFSEERSRQLEEKYKASQADIYINDKQNRWYITKAKHRQNYMRNKH